jgi:hypothetical protein
MYMYCSHVEASVPGRASKVKQDVGQQEGFHGDVPAAPAPERHHERSVAQLHQADAWRRWVDERGGEFMALVICLRGVFLY